MSFTPLMMKLVASLLDELPEGPDVIELGNQTFDPTLSGSLVDSDDLMFPLLLDFLDQRAAPFDRAALLELQSLSVEAQKPHTRSYFKALGFSAYDAIDVNSTYGSLVMDLNVDLAERYQFHRRYALVTNNGTGEHVFNQHAVFKNMHQLTAVDGVMLFVLPFYNWLNHGFFNFNPLLFADLAAANGYQVLKLGVGCAVGQLVSAGSARVGDGQMRLRWQPEGATLNLEDFQRRGSIRPRTPRNMASAVLRAATGRPGAGQASPLPRVVEQLAERVPNINVVAALRKTREQEFAMPLQGMYAGQNVEDEALRRQYRA